MRRLFLFAALAVAAPTLAGALPAFAQTAQPVPTPGPNGTPVTFGGVPNGVPIPANPGRPDDVPVPTTTANPAHASKDFKEHHEIYVVGDYLVTPRIYNEYSAGYRTGKVSYAIKGAAEFNIGVLPVMLEGESRNQAYRHEADGNAFTSCATEPGASDPGCVKRIGSNGSGYVRAFVPRDFDVDGRFGFKLLDPRIYIAASYLWKTNNYGYGYSSGPGLGLEKLPDLEGPLGVYFGLYYYPNVTGRYTGLNQVTSQGLRYRIFRYEGGLVVAPRSSPLFIDLGVEGDRENAFGASPSSETHFEPYAGLGIHPDKL